MLLHYFRVLNFGKVLESLENEKPSQIALRGFLMNSESENYPIEILLNAFTVKPLLTLFRY